ncbi:alpha/beta hydrolase [Microcoleus sp. FACHB-1515]|uniref:alpha/beta hydrolase n=2 Tax=Cyanophyceae TaxID=3028117 RepID=UPI001F552A7F|nr:alpha/beta hydrolase [Microcoleus sp. FACHB-1515]
MRRLLIGEWSWKRLMRSLLFIYLCFALYVYFRADSMIFLPPPASYQDSPEIIKIPVSDRERISAIHLPNSQAKYTLLYSHGNAEDLGDIRSLLEELNRWGFNIFAYDYRGYGTSDGRPSERNAYVDVEAAYGYLTQQLRVPIDRVIAYGRSVGGGPAVDLATRHAIAGLVLENTFTSAFRVVVPFPLLPFDKFPNLSKIARVKSPVLVMHGTDDRTIPFSHGQQLYEAAPEPKMHLWVAGAGHNDFTIVAGDRHRIALQEFQQLIEQNSS